MNTVHGDLEVLYLSLFLATLLPGLWLRQYEHWRRDLAILLLTTVGVESLQVLTLTAAYYTKEVREMVPNFRLGLLYGGWRFGLPVISIALITGVLLYKSSQRYRP